MQQRKVETISAGVKKKQEIPLPPPPPPPLLRFWIRKTVTESVTNQEIAKFWRQKHIEEEDHLLAAIKAAARIRARNLSGHEYKLFEESLKNDEEGTNEKKSTTINDGKVDEKSNEVRVGIKDWWTKSKYAYLNQPAMDSMESSKSRTSTYTPHLLSYKPTPLYPTSLGVF